MDMENKISNNGIVTPLETAFRILGKFDLDLDDEIIAQRVAKALLEVNEIPGVRGEGFNIVASAFYAWINDFDIGYFAETSKGGSLLIAFAQGIILSNLDVYFPMEHAFGDNPTEGFRGSAVTDPLTMHAACAYYELPAKFSLKKIIDELMNDLGNGEPKILESLRDAFIDLANDIDLVLKG
jgi:hypothetical protein